MQRTPEFIAAEKKVSGFLNGLRTKAETNDLKGDEPVVTSLMEQVVEMGVRKDKLNFGTEKPPKKETKVTQNTTSTEAPTTDGTKVSSRTKPAAKGEATLAMGKPADPLKTLKSQKAPTDSSVKK